MTFAALTGLPAGAVGLFRPLAGGARGGGVVLNPAGLGDQAAVVEEVRAEGVIGTCLSHVRPLSG